MARIASGTDGQSGDKAGPAHNSPVLMYPSKAPRQFEWGELGTEEEARLNALGLTPQDFTVVRDFFIGSPFDYVMDSGNDFRQVTNGALSNDRIIGHLEGRYVIGTGARRNVETRRYMTHLLWFDLDAGDDLIARYTLLREAIPTLPLVFRSSESGGLHCCFVLNEPAELFDLLNPFSGDGLVPKLLARVGLELAPGRIEFYPAARSLTTWGNAIRFPFGIGSWLLCPDELIALRPKGPSAAREVARQLRDDEVDLLSLSELHGLAQNASAKGRKPKPRKRSARGPSVTRVREIAELDHRGIQGPGRLNDALFTKSVDFAVRGVRLDDASALLHLWLDARHNGQSRTYNQSPERAQAEAKRVVERVYSDWEFRSRWQTRPGLTLAEVALIDALTPTGAELVGPSGKPQPRLKYQRFLFDLLNGMKQWVITRAVETAQLAAERNPRVNVESTEFDALFRNEAQRWWPYAPVPLFVVENPYQFRLTIPGVSEAVMNAFWRLTTQSMLFKQTRPGSAMHGRSAAYAIQLDFADEAFERIDDALVHLFTKAQLRERYSDYHARTIVKQGRLVSTPGLSLSCAPSIADCVSRSLHRRPDCVVQAA